MGILIGTGFYSSAQDHKAKTKFLWRWWCNTREVCRRVVIVDNSSVGLGEVEAGVIRVNNNLGHNTDFASNHSRLLGWSMSWIIPATIAYSENLDFVYKEQDCLAFGDWLPEVCQGNIAFGRNSTMPCEQSLFFLKRDIIPDFIAGYTSIPFRDNEMMTEDKMARAALNFRGVHVFDTPFGRERPLEFYEDRPWYAQRWTEAELAELDKHPKLL